MPPACGRNPGAATAPVRGGPLTRPMPQRCCLALPHAAIEERVKLVTDLREGIEIVFTPEYPSYLQALFKPFCDILRTVPPQLADNTEHKLRNLVLDILNRLPQNDAFKPYVGEMFEVCMAALRDDNQDNAVHAIKVVFDLHKSYRTALEPQAAQLLEFVVTVGVGVGVGAQRVHRSPPSRQAARGGGSAGARATGWWGRAALAPPGGLIVRAGAGVHLTLGQGHSDGDARSSACVRSPGTVSGSVSTTLAFEGSNAAGMQGRRGGAWRGGFDHAEHAC